MIIHSKSGGQKHYATTAYLDSDDIWEPDKLEIYTDKASAIDKPFLMFSDLVRIEKSGNEKKHSDDYGVINEYFGDLDDDLLCDSYEALKLIYEPYSFYPSTFMVPRSVHEKIQWRTKPVYNQDLFFALEASRFCDFVYIDKSLTKYRVRKDSITGTIGETPIRWKSLAFDITRKFYEAYPLSDKEKDLTGRHLAKLALNLLKNSAIKRDSRSFFSYLIYLSANRHAYDLVMEKIARKRSC